MHSIIEVGTIDHITVEPSADDGASLHKIIAKSNSSQPLEITDMEIITSVKKDSMACQRNEYRIAVNLLCCLINVTDN